MAKAKQIYMNGNITTPRGVAIFPNLETTDQYSEKYQIRVAVEDTPEWNATIKKLLDFQNTELQKSGEDPQDALLCLKDEMVKQEGSDKKVPSGRQFLTFKSADRSKFSVVGPDKRTLGREIAHGATVRVNGSAAFGFMRDDPYVTLYLSAVQEIEAGTVGGVDAFDDESGGDGAPFDDETPTSSDNTVVRNLA